MKTILKNYSSIILLLIGITIGSLIGLFLPNVVEYIKPIGDIFLNLLFVAVIPLLFFAISSAIANIESNGKLGKILGVMTSVFVVTIAIAAVLTIVGLWAFPVTAIKDASAISETISTNPEDSWGDKIVRFVSVGEFVNLLSRQNILAFVIFSFLIGISVRKSGEVGKPFLNFLLAGNEVMQNLLTIIMKLGPIGLGAYFAYQVQTLGPELFGFYAKPLAFYYIFGTVFFFVIYSLYSFIGNGKSGIKNYWRFNITPSLTAVSTCSSLATLPANLLAAKKMGIPNYIASVVIPLGNTLYKNGSSISSILKIYVAFAILDWNFFEPTTLITAVGITLLVSMVAGGIPNGGFIGEMLMISIYGIPNEAVPAIMIIGALVDPLATILNATGDTVAAMLVTKFSGEKFFSNETELETSTEM
ncbi:dicarboxylate/amino acid:cation symporter [Sphingobacterium litopenaei]|uniref:Dicarboxylate/amino acid:cation symporter n=1 Tax=Sphingobacterium litopenaei TaxID=2763500 RepID=A0ABR7YDE9_9SPHI|nr:dicarboxylate/amino acid:cation symporter [Sphingobacterium litopenaei]MBD1429238.1 dicarboxylate/amino acid:cation symporter [Sphingobacterium litopenaei]